MAAAGVRSKALRRESASRCGRSRTLPGCSTRPRSSSTAGEAAADARAGRLRRSREKQAITAAVHILALVRARVLMDRPLWSRQRMMRFERNGAESLFVLGDVLTENVPERLSLLRAKIDAL